MEKQLALLVEQDSSSQAIHALFQWKKKRLRHYSMAKLARQLGMRSTGYLSDALHGKRTLNMKYADALCQAFGLDTSSAELLLLLLKRDHAKTATLKEDLSRKLEEFKRAAHKEVAAETVPVDMQAFDFEVFCAFGLFQSRPKRQDLIHFFGRERAIELDRSLRKLLHHRWIAADEQCESYRLMRKNITFRDDDSGSTASLSHADFVKQAIEQASKNLHRMIQQPQKCYFAAFLVSTDHLCYANRLADMKKQVQMWNQQLETGKANTLVRINVQIFPTVD